MGDESSSDDSDGGPNRDDDTNSNANGDRPHVKIVATGGTIGSTTSNGDEPPNGDGAADRAKTPTLSGTEILEAVPQVAEYATVDVKEVCQVSGFQITASHAHAIRDAVEQAAEDGVDGIVITHGTDTMAETAYFLALTRTRSRAATARVPVALTGSQRPFDQLGTDGPPNLLGAVKTVTDDRLQGTHATVLTFNDTVHTARRVIKNHTSKLETFQSPNGGPLAEHTPDGLRYFHSPTTVTTEPPLPAARLEARVEIITNHLGADGRAVRRALADGVDGLILAGTGLGNATEALGEALEEAINESVPVVCTSRCHAGTTAGRYGGPGGGKTLRAAGALDGGDLPPWKARLKLALACSACDGLEEIRTVFAGQSR